MKQKKKPEKPNRKADIKLTVMLTEQENEAFEEMIKTQVLSKTLMVKWALYRFSQDEGYRFPWDEKYSVPSPRRKE